MTLILAWLRLELRRKWRSLIVLTLLIAISTGTVLTAIAGARRGASAMDRLLEVTRPATALVQPTQHNFDWAAVRALPEVETLTVFPVTGYSIEGVPDLQPVGFFAPGDAEAMRTIERAVVLEGRLADPSRADEAVITPNFATTYGVGVGDTVTLKLFTIEGVDGFFSRNIPPQPTGPRVATRIVGVVRSLYFSDKVGDSGRLYHSPGLIATYRPNLLGSGQFAYLNALVRLRAGAADLPAFRAHLAGMGNGSDIPVSDSSERVSHTQNVNDFESICLLVFGLAALAAATVLVGQLVARHAAASVSELRVLQGPGMTPRQIIAAATAGPMLASAVGATVGVVLTVGASWWMPFGAAATVEPAPGIDADWAVLATGWVLVFALALVGAASAAVLELTAATSQGTPHRSAVASAAARAGLPVPVVLGTRFAFETGRGQGAVPVRPALLGAVTGVLGVLAAFTFSAGVADAGGNLGRFGQTFQLVAHIGSNGDDAVPSARVLAAMASDPDVVGITDVRTTAAQSGTESVMLSSYDPVGRPMPVVLTAGRLPTAVDEVALAPRSARALGSAPGSVVELTGNAGRRSFTVTGTAFMPQGPHNTYADGGWLTPGGYDSIFTGFKDHVGLIALRPGADPAAVQARLRQAASAVPDGQFAVFLPPYTPTELFEIRDVRVLPVVLGGFLAVLAVGAVGHALATAVRRRRRDVAVLRALGMTGCQARGVVIIQATVLAGVGLLFGVPLGVALGRTVWQAVANSTPLYYVPPVAFWALLLIVPLALVIVNLLAAFPGQRAARLPISEILRVE
jgi:FtsX-like permease family/MacB-like periplasmic core domain